MEMPASAARWRKAALTLTSWLLPRAKARAETPLTDRGDRRDPDDRVLGHRPGGAEAPDGLAGDGADGDEQKDAVGEG